MYWRQKLSDNFESPKTKSAGKLKIVDSLEFSVAVKELPQFDLTHARKIEIIGQKTSLVVLIFLDVQVQITSVKFHADSINNTSSRKNETSENVVPPLLLPNVLPFREKGYFCRPQNGEEQLNTFRNT